MSCQHCKNQECLAKIISFNVDEMKKDKEIQEKIKSLLDLLTNICQLNGEKLELESKMKELLAEMSEDSQLDKIKKELDDLKKKNTIATITTSTHQ